MAIKRLRKYRCGFCLKILVRASTNSRWIESYCSKSGRDVRCLRYLKKSTRAINPEWLALIGRQIGDLTVLKVDNHQIGKWKGSAALVQCACGNEKWLSCARLDGGGRPVQRHCGCKTKQNHEKMKHMDSMITRLSKERRKSKQLDPDYRWSEKSKAQLKVL